jgi:hypothetical protein
VPKGGALGVPPSFKLEYSLKVGVAIEQHAQHPPGNAAAVIVISFRSPAWFLVKYANDDPSSD